VMGRNEDEQHINGDRYANGEEEAQIAVQEDDDAGQSGKS